MSNIRYLIKVTATAKPNNPNFTGKVQTTYYGKDQKLIAGTYTYMNPEPSKWDVLSYGYKVTPSKHALDFWNVTMNTPIGDNPIFWNYKAEVVLDDLASQSFITLQPLQARPNLKEITL